MAVAGEIGGSSVLGSIVVGASDAGLDLDQQGNRAVFSTTGLAAAHKTR
jgi:hypothetical protein